MSTETDYVFGTFCLSVSRRILTNRGQPIEITPTIFDALLYFLRNSRRLVTKQELLENVWRGRIVEESNLRQTIFSLRKALGEDGKGLITTVGGRGYQFTAAVAREDVDEASINIASSNAPHGTALGTKIRQRPLAWSMGAVAALVLAVVGGTYISHNRATKPLPSNHLVVLADFANQTHEQIFDGSLQNLLRVDLNQSPFVEVVPDRQARATLKLMEKPDGTPLTGPLAAEVCARQNADAVLQGMIAPLGSSYLVSIIASDCSNGRQLAAAKQQVDRREQVVGALDSLIATIRGQLGESLASIQRYNVPLVEARTGSLDALKALSQAKSMFEHGQQHDAIPVLRHALDLDPNLGEAHELLGVIYLTAQDHETGAAELTEAYRLRDHFNARDRYHLLNLYDEYALGDELAAIRDGRAFAELYPRTAIAWSNLANAENDIGLYEQALPDGQHALALGTPTDTTYATAILTERALGRFAVALALTNKAVQNKTAGENVHRERMLLAEAMGDPRLLATEIAYSEATPGPMLLALRAHYLASEGRLKEAQILLSRMSALLDEPTKRDGATVLLANWSAQLGLEDRARQLMARIDPDFDDDDAIETRAEVGDVPAVKAMLRRLTATHPQETLLNKIYAPQARAQLALRSGDPDGAIAALQPALPYQIRAYRTYWLLGSAYLAKGYGAKAAEAFRIVLGHPGWWPGTLYLPLSHLGLARALRLTGDFVGARTQNAAFEKGFERADTPIPILKTAAIETSPPQ